MYIVVLAGGTGTRLWPRSRRTSPKQLLDLVDEHSMLQETVMRVQPLVPNDHIFISTGQDYAAPILAQLPDLPRENIIVELSGKGTAPCIGLAAIHLQRFTDDDVMVTLHADAYVRDEEEFRRILAAAEEAARRDHLVTIGITPDYAETAFGYIERGDGVEHINGRDIYAVKRFTEKPDAVTAQEFCDAGTYYWNSGMFGWKISRILSEMERCQPQLHAQLREIQAAFGLPGEQAIAERVWRQIENQTIDVGVMERAQDVVVIPADIGWSDIGNWGALADILQGQGRENLALGNGQLVDIDTEGCLTYSRDRLIATIGLQDLVIVDTGDAVLVCPKERAQDVKSMVDELKRRGLQRYL